MLAKVAERAYYSPPRNTKRTANAAATRVVGQQGVSEAGFAALTGREKNLLQTVDETLNALHNLVSPLRRKQRSDSERQSRELEFFNNQTTDKCGRLMANATGTSVFVMLQKLSVLAQ